MTPELSTLLAALAGGMAIVAGVVYWWINRTPSVDRDDDQPLPLFGGLTPEERMRSPAVSRPAVPSGTATDFAPRATRPEPSPMPTPPRPAPVIREFVTRPAVQMPAPAPSSAPSAADQPVVSPAGIPGTMVEAHALRFSVPAEGTLQFLPGRLEIGAGLDAGREIRFVRVEGPNGIEVTFGRADGELYRHIQLRDKTVSRAHAVMRFREVTWSLQNLSHTNPVLLNGVQMAGDAEHPLADGDRVEMGEVLFTFRSR
ncbi:FHA domain-containing protein [Gemmatimonas sp.]|jgi:hypothetical protein|uniref:FHA domain-containing protein n=1 Tax=Gemmatimonas sp. TaxID=1962908 RepID=UPI0037BFD173